MTLAEVKWLLSDRTHALPIAGGEGMRVWHGGPASPFTLRLYDVPDLEEGE